MIKLRKFVCLTIRWQTSRVLSWISKNSEWCQLGTIQTMILHIFPCKNQQEPCSGGGVFFTPCLLNYRSDEVSLNPLEGWGCYRGSVNVFSTEHLVNLFLFLKCTGVGYSFVKKCFVSRGRGSRPWPPGGGGGAAEKLFWMTSMSIVL